MKKLPFKTSSTASIGIELELQLINPKTYDMASCAKEFLKQAEQTEFHRFLKPEITQSMIEVNSSSHLSTQKLYEEILLIRNFICEIAAGLEIKISGGGTHPFQIWSSRKIFPLPRYKNLTKIYCHLAKQATVFGQHVHVGCGNGEEAIYLTHVLSRFVPHFIALSASSPYLEGIDTGYHSARSTLFNAFPMGGFIPYLENWQAFCDYYALMKDLNIVDSMKDFYWDIRPKPEFGTVEVRVCDTPLTIERAVMVAAYIQSLSLYLLQERPFEISPHLYIFYKYNRFQASRYGFEGDFLNPINKERTTVGEDLLATLLKMQKYIGHLKNEKYLKQINELIVPNYTDATRLREFMKETDSLTGVVNSACDAWEFSHDFQKK